MLRLLKAAFTFDGGADYVVWKIERHRGVRLRTQSLAEAVSAAGRTGHLLAAAPPRHPALIRRRAASPRARYQATASAKPSCSVWRGAHPAGRACSCDRHCPVGMAQFAQLLRTEHVRRAEQAPDIAHSGDSLSNAARRMKQPGVGIAHRSARRRRRPRARCSRRAVHRRQSTTPPPGACSMASISAIRSSTWIIAARAAGGAGQRHEAAARQLEEHQRLAIARAIHHRRADHRGARTQLPTHGVLAGALAAGIVGQLRLACRDRRQHAAGARQVRAA